MMKNQNHNIPFLMKVLIIVSIVAIVLLIVSTFIFPFLGIKSSALGDIATVISIVLAIVSIIYTYVSGEKTVENMDEIRHQSKNLVNQIMKSSPCYVNNDVQDCLDNAKQYSNISAKYIFDKDNIFTIFLPIVSFYIEAVGFMHYFMCQSFLCSPRMSVDKKNVIHLY